MKYADYLRVLNEHIQSHPLKLGTSASVLALLYESYIELQGFENEQIKADFNELYRAMNGMELEEMDRVLYPICTLCRDHERSGFIHGIKVGIMLNNELSDWRKAVPDHGDGLFCLLGSIRCAVLDTWSCRTHHSHCLQQKPSGNVCIASGAYPCRSA